MGVPRIPACTIEALQLWCSMQTDSYSCTHIDEEYVQPSVLRGCLFTNGLDWSFLGHIGFYECQLVTGHQCWGGRQPTKEITLVLGWVFSKDACKLWKSLESMSMAYMWRAPII